ncbi:MAG: hypothetical protein ACO25M_10280 [Limnohabitans sp.]
MVNPALARATNRILARMGDDAVLRGTVDCKAHIDRDVQMTDREGNMFVATFVATISKDHAPEPEDDLTVGSESFVLETLIDDNGYSARFIARKE